MKERFQNKLRCRRRARGETLRELAQDVQRLMALAYPGEKSALSEHIATGAFLSTLDDPELELKIWEREPDNLDVAVKLAQRYEVFKATVETSSNARHRTNRQVFHESEEGAVTEDLEVRIANVERQLGDARPPSGNMSGQSAYSSQPVQSLASHITIPNGKGKKNRNVMDNGDKQ